MFHFILQQMYSFVPFKHHPSICHSGILCFQKAHRIKNTAQHVELQHKSVYKVKCCTCVLLSQQRGRALAGHVCSALARLSNRIVQLVHNT